MATVVLSSFPFVRSNLLNSVFIEVWHFTPQRALSPHAPSQPHRPYLTLPAQYYTEAHLLCWLLSSVLKGVSLPWHFIFHFCRDLKLAWNRWPSHRTHELSLVCDDSPGRPTICAVKQQDMLVLVKGLQEAVWKTRETKWEYNCRTSWLTQVTSFTGNPIRTWIPLTHSNHWKIKLTFDYHN